MTDIIIYVALVIVGAAIGFFITGVWLRKAMVKKSANLIAEAEEKAEVIKKEKMLQAKEKFLGLKSDYETYVNNKKKNIGKQEARLKQKENTLNQRLDDLNKKKQEVKTQHDKVETKLSQLSKKEERLDVAQQQQVEQLESLSGLSVEEAKKMLIDTIKEEAKAEAMVYIEEIQQEAKLTADQKAKKIVIETIQRTATEQAIENAVTVFPLENDDVKGRIIGREGRNIRAIENLTGIELIIDDSPDTILLSGFDPVRREIARIALRKLVTDGRIHPARIEEVVNKTKKQMDKEILETGKRTLIDLGIHNMHPELMRVIGRMKYRSSYGQNLLQHSREVANLCATMASELGLDPKKAKRAGLLHDIGKVPDSEPELPHALLGMKWAERFKEHADICNAIGAHHDEIEMTSLYSPIVQVCDAISGARPGARREVVEAYIQRLKNLENMAKEYEGVVKTYAIQAGRELRVIVSAEQINDQKASQLSYDLSKQVQEEMKYPGQIKITVIRETRAINYAK